MGVDPYGIKDHPGDQLIPDPIFGVGNMTDCNPPFFIGPIRSIALNEVR